MKENLVPGKVLDIAIESLGNKGDGVAMYGETKVLVPFALPGEKAKVSVTAVKNNLAETKTLEILEKSMNRETPPCKHFYACGGCYLQHMNPDFYKEFKRRIFSSALARAGFPLDNPEIIIVGENSRRRAIFKVASLDGNVALGFYENNSHNVVDIKECYILEPQIFSLLPSIRKLLAALKAQNEITDIMVMLADNGIDILFYAKVPLPDEDAKRIVSYADENDIARIAWKYNNRIMPVVVRKQPLMNFGAASVELPPESFLQPTRRGQEIITEMVVKALAREKNILDLFCGAGTYSFALAKKAKVHGVEMGTAMVTAAKKAAKGMKATFEERNLDKNPISLLELSAYDAAAINPPRTGALAQSRLLAKSKLGKIVMVSCSAETFARDAKILKEGGYKLNSAAAIDQFHYTPHLEIVAEFLR